MQFELSKICAVLLFPCYVCCLFPTVRRETQFLIPAPRHPGFSLCSTWQLGRDAFSFSDSHTKQLPPKHSGSESSFHIFIWLLTESPGRGNEDCSPLTEKKEEKERKKTRRKKRVGICQTRDHTLLESQPEEDVRWKGFQFAFNCK